jgi:hypothetical protein
LRGVWRMLAAVVCCLFRLHLRAAARLLHFRNRRLCRTYRKSDRARDRQAKQKSQRRSHPALDYSFSRAGSIFVLDFSARFDQRAELGDTFAATLRLFATLNSSHNHRESRHDLP